MTTMTLPTCDAHHPFLPHPNPVNIANGGNIPLMCDLPWGHSGDHAAILLHDGGYQRRERWSTSAATAYQRCNWVN
jgi:hypothetical protein